jgi:hypothetical protein
MLYLSKPLWQAYSSIGLLLALLLQSPWPALGSEDVHIAYLTDCSMYSGECQMTRCSGLQQVLAKVDLQSSLMLCTPHPLQTGKLWAWRSVTR